MRTTRSGRCRGRPGGGRSPIGRPQVAQDPKAGSPSTAASARSSSTSLARAIRARDVTWAVVEGAEGVEERRDRAPADHAHGGGAGQRGDAAGIAALYEPDAVMAYPAGSQTVGRAAIRELWEQVLSHAPHFEQEEPLPTLISGDLALTSTPPKDGSGARAQVVRRQPDGTWLRVLDQPEFTPPRA